MNITPPPASTRAAVPPYLAPVAADPARWAAVVALARQLATVPEDRALAFLRAVSLLADDPETARSIDAVGWVLCHPSYLEVR